MSRGKLAAVESVKVTTVTTGRGKSSETTTRTQFKLYSKIAALENLARRFNVFPHKTDVNVTGAVLLAPMVLSGSLPASKALPEGVDAIIEEKP